ncbi:hypothetical protein [Mycolicibacterium sp. P9-64]|uniref:hypothetical protein n=1 Tax=Mycolicibacterium sp. P9-64 TaxID=2024612 RepID=UPI0011EE151C|nr:hypothetical protein [Mycolicibacterium sp. P9-64]
MVNVNEFSGVKIGVTGMSWTLHVSGSAAATAHPASAYAASGAQAITPPKRRRHAAAATVASVKRGTT